ncbi:SCO family protein [Flexibacterium corallicola]|uniref:SCO family protein n=1 Tax=Flexibacterium corallicola TaxID=3037259 RepID=UPI00286F84B2|nr:SCO family protein [Pseudovibrio sp. M1P-2-3]
MKLAKIIRYGAWAAIAALVFSIAALSIDSLRNNEQIASAPTVKIGGPFSLLDKNGNSYTEANLGGKPSLMFFGFTYCPDVCPTTLADMQLWIDDLGDKAEDVNFIFISVDPERDTPEVIGDYVAAFSEKIQPLTGSREQVDTVIKAFRVYARKVPLEDGDYTMDHTAPVYMMDADNNFTGTIGYGEIPEVALEKIRKLLSTS